jgi:hypothetical protein
MIRTSRHPFPNVHLPALRDPHDMSDRNKREDDRRNCNVLTSSCVLLPAQERRASPAWSPSYAQSITQEPTLVIAPPRPLLSRVPNRRGGQSRAYSVRFAKRRACRAALEREANVRTGNPKIEPEHHKCLRCVFASRRRLSPFRQAPVRALPTGNVAMIRRRAGKTHPGRFELRVACASGSPCQETTVPKRRFCYRSCFMTLRSRAPLIGCATMSRWQLRVDA